MNKVSRFLALFSWFTITLFGCKEDTIDFIPLGTISGQVIQSNTSEPLEGVEITTIPATSVVYTDSTGTFRFEEVAENDYRLRARLENYQIETISISVAGNAESVSTVFLTPEKGLLLSAINPMPIDESKNVGTETQINWGNPNDSTINVMYDVEIFEANSDKIFQKFSDVEDTLVVLENLKFNTKYFWQVTTKNSLDEVEYSKIWKFTTVPFPDNPILFTIPNNEGYTEIYSTDENGESITRLTYNVQNKYSPVYNSDRSRIAFIGNDGIDQHIYLMNSEGREINKVTKIPVASYHQQGRGFAWSPDDSKFIYCHYDKLYSINTDGSNLTEISVAPANRHFRSCDWGESTNQILVETIGANIYDGEIYLMDADGSNMTELVANDLGIMENPSFSIDGLNFIYTKDFSENESLGGRQLNSHIIWSPLADPSNLTDLSEDKTNGTNDLFPRVSSDGAKVIFVNQKNDGKGKSIIYSVDVADTANRTMILEDANFPSWR